VNKANWIALKSDKRLGYARKSIYGSGKIDLSGYSEKNNIAFKYIGSGKT
jgi:hypothetical protein